MGKKIALKIGNGSSYCGSNIYGGKLDKYHYIIRYDNSSLCFNIFFNVTGKEDISSLGKSIKKLDKDATIKYKNSILNIVGVCDNADNLALLVNPLLVETEKYLESNKYREVCKNCKNEKDVFLIDNDGEINYYCDKCFNDMVKEGKYKEDNSKKNKENLALGILGSIIGIIPGILFWCLLNYLSIEPGIAGIFITMGSALGFKWLGKNVKTSGMIISILIGLIGIIVAHEISSTIYIYHLYKSSYDINLWKAYQSIPYYLNTIADFKKLFFNQLFTGYLLSLIGIFSTYSLHRQSIYSYDIRKIGE